MSKATKLSIGILFILLIGSIVVAGMSLIQKQTIEQDLRRVRSDAEEYENLSKEQIQKIQSLQSQLTSLSSLEEKANKAEASRARAEEELVQLKNKIQDYEDQVADLRDEILKVKADRETFKGRVDVLKQERDELMAKLQEKPAPVVENSADKLVSVQSSLNNFDEEHYVAQIIKEKAALELQIENLKKNLSDNSVQIEELKKVNSDLQLEISRFKDEKASIEREIKYGQDLANNLSVELARAKGDKKFSEERVAELSKENTDLRGQLKQLTDSKVSLEKNIGRLTEDKLAIEKKLAETESVIQSQIDEIWNIKTNIDKRFNTPAKVSKSNEIELPPIIVSAPGVVAAEAISSGAKQSGRGSVVEVNEANNFVIVNIGEAAGVRVADKFSVYRGEQYVGEVEVIQTRKDISAADIKRASTKILKGDVIN